MRDHEGVLPPRVPVAMLHVRLRRAASRCDRLSDERHPSYSPHTFLSNMILFLYGEESYLIHERLRALRFGFVKKYDALRVSETVMEGEKFSLDDFARALHSGGLFTMKRLIIVRDAVKNIRDSETKKRIIELLKGLNDERTVVIFIEYGSGVKGADALLAYLKSLAHAEKFHAVQGSALEWWIRAEVKKQGGVMEPSAMSELARRAGGDLWKIHSEIEKLLAHANGRPVIANDIQLFLEHAVDDNVFHLTDALGEQNAKLALELVDAQLKLGAEPLALLSTLAWYWKTLVRVKRKIREGVPQSAIAKELGIHPFVAEKAVRQASRFAVSQLTMLFDQLLEIDRTLKTTSEDAGLLFDLFVVRACAVADKKSP